MIRPRRLRTSAVVRKMVRETQLKTSDLIYPLFVVEGNNIKEEIASLEGIYHFSIDQVEVEVKELIALGVEAVILFGMPEHKDACGSEAYSEKGIVQQAIRMIKKVVPHMLVITDICMCQYTSHGHCGILDDKGYVANDATLEYLSKIAISHAVAGADMVAPSDMMDGRVGHMRKALDYNGYTEVGIMAYSTKYASSFYGPVREATHSVPSFGDRKTYQMDIANTDEALREVALDIEEGADIVMVKPALAYLDVVRRVKDHFNMPLAAYNVSGEYAMLKLAVKSGILDEKAIYESLLSIKRAGADMIITYFAKDFAKKLQEGHYEAY